MIFRKALANRRARWVFVTLCILVLVAVAGMALSQLYTLNLSVSVQESLLSFVGVENPSIDTIVSRATGHSEQKIGIWGTTHVSYVRFLYNCTWSSLDCGLDHVIVDTTVIARFNFPEQFPALTTIEYGIDLVSREANGVDFIHVISTQRPAIAHVAWHDFHITPRDALEMAVAELESLGMVPYGDDDQLSVSIAWPNWETEEDTWRITMSVPEQSGTEKYVRFAINRASGAIQRIEN